MSTEVPEMYRSSPTLKELSKLPKHVLAQELLHMAERAENSSTKNFLHYKFMPDNAALELGAHTLLSQGFRLSEKQSLHLASVCEDDDTDEVLDYGDCIFDVDDDDDDDEYGEEDKIPQLMPALAFSPELSHNLDGGGTLHRLIIGDNYHALAGLQASLATHSDGVYDIIYIDPPYNTGKGFIYNDNNVDPDDPWRSTKWASMIEPRLRLASGLMKDTGVIFISIDDNEQSSLKLLCDSVFGRQNFIANLIWDGKGAKSDPSLISIGHEYMLVYAKCRSAIEERWVVRKDGIDEVMAAVTAAWSNGSNGAEKASSLYRNWVNALPKNHPARQGGMKPYNRIDDNGRLYRLSPVAAPPGGGPSYTIDHPVTGKPLPTPQQGWRWTEERMLRSIEEGVVVFGSDENSSLQYKLYMDEHEYRTPTSIISNYSGNATTHVARVFGDKVFDFPKDHTVLARWFRMVAPKDAKILDFYGGSGSTAEAVLALNAEDGGTREVTIVTNDEGATEDIAGIGTRITRERIVRVMTGENWGDGKPHEGYGGRLGVWRVGASRSVDFSSTADEGLHHSWNSEAGKWGVWQNTPLLHRADDYYDVYTDGDDTYSLVFHDIDHLKGSLVDEVLGEFPGAQVFLPYQHSYTHSHGFYVDDVPNAIPLPLGVVSPIQNGVADSMLTPYIKRGGGSYLDRIAALTGLSDDDRED